MKVIFGKNVEILSTMAIEGFLADIDDEVYVYPYKNIVLSTLFMNDSRVASLSILSANRNIP